MFNCIIILFIDVHEVLYFILAWHSKFWNILKRFALEQFTVLLSSIDALEWVSMFMHSIKVFALEQFSMFLHSINIHWNSVHLNVPKVLSVSITGTVYKWNSISVYL